MNELKKGGRLPQAAPGHSGLRPEPASRLGHSASVPDADTEIAQIEAAFHALQVLDDAGRARGLTYLLGRFGQAQSEPSASRLITPDEEVVGAVAQAAGYTLAQIQGKSRKVPLVIARNAAALALHRLGYTSTATGRALCRDHSTVLYAIKQAEADEVDKPYFRRLVEIGVAQAIEARRAETGADTGSVHESAVPKGCAQ